MGQDFLGEVFNPLRKCPFLLSYIAMPFVSRSRCYAMQNLQPGLRIRAIGLDPDP